MADILTETNVSLNNEKFTALLPNLQGNILKHHGRTHAFHIFLTLDEKIAASAKTWIANFAAKTITSSFKQLDDARVRKTTPNFDGGPFFNLSLSMTGYRKLGIPGELIPATDPAFVAGMQNRTDVTTDDLKAWEESFKSSIDVLIIVADGNISTVTREKDSILQQVSVFAKIAHVQKGKILRNEHGIGIEHFGYADGISQPNFLAPANPGAKQWDDDGALLNTLLVKEPLSEDGFGSYFVFRKLEQNVARFKREEKTLPAVIANDGKSNDELAGAMIVGRFEDGTEVINDSRERRITKESDLRNDFDYRDDAIGGKSNGSKCPFHAHIRITNPREDVSIPFAKQVRLTRRGIPYNDIGRDEFELEQDQPDSGVGLLFMCYQSSIENQFEFIQHSWANDGEIGSGRFIGQDAIIGQGANNTQKNLPNQWGVSPNQQPVPLTFKDFVIMKGGEYFFTPSISFLKTL